MRYGQGPDEYLGLTPIKRIERKGDDLISLTYEPNRRQLIEWNITQSIENGRDSILRIGYYQKPTDFYVTYSALYRIGKSEYLGYTPGELNEENMFVPAYWILEGPNIEPVKSISFVKELIPNPHSKVYDGNFFDSFTSLSPDNTKIVNAMNWLEQINIINLQNCCSRLCYAFLCAKFEKGSKNEKSQNSFLHFPYIHIRYNSNPCTRRRI